MSTYWERFHAERPGAVGEFLTRLEAGHLSPHTWLARSVTPYTGGRHAIVLDVACGDGRMTEALDDADCTVVGLDRSQAQLDRARERTAEPRGDHVWLRADATNLPFASHSVDALTCAWGLAAFDDPATAAGEFGRVVRPGGLVAVIAPAMLPLAPGDLRVRTTLNRMLGRPSFPLQRGGVKQLLTVAGLQVVENNHDRYHFTVKDRADAEVLLSGMYLPKASDRRVGRALNWLERRAEEARASGLPGVRVPVPLRRVVALA